MTLTTDDVLGWLPPQPRRAAAGVPIGHGPLADCAAEPVEFARLLQHIERSDIVTHADRWHDTMPSAPAPLDDTSVRWPACGGACAEQARPCPRPRSCWLTVDHEDDGIGVIRGLVWAIGITGAAVAGGLLLASFI